MKLIMLVIIIGLTVTAFVEHNKSAAALEETAVAKQLAENIRQATADVRNDANAVQKQLDDANKQVTEGKEAARKLTEDHLQAQKQMQESTEASAKQTTELEEVKKKLADAEAQLATMQTDLATTKAQATVAKDELSKLQEKSKLPPLGTATGRK